jgi:hypothetical protein
LFAVNDLLKGRELILTENVRFIESAAFPNLPFVTQLVAAEPQTLIGCRAGSQSNTKTQSPGVVLGARSRQLMAPGNVVLGGFEPFFGFFGARSEPFRGSLTSIEPFVNLKIKPKTKKIPNRGQIRSKSL